MTPVEALVEACHVALAEGDPAAAVAEELRRALHRPGALADASGDDLALWCHTDELTVVALPVPPGFRFWPHEHRMWAVTGMLAGDELDVVFERADGPPRPVRRFTVAEGGVAVHPHDVVHTAENPSGSRMALGIHVYGGDPIGTDCLEWDPVTGASRTVDAETSARRRAAVAAMRR